MPFYLEAMSRLVFDELVNKPLEQVDNRTDLPKPVRRFRGVYSEVFGKELPLDTDGIRDLFTIRNKITAHAAGHAQLEGVDSGWNRIDENVAYGKLTGLPSNYSSFTSKHAGIALDETVAFITKFLDSLRAKIPEGTLKLWWPTEL
jgi:hypothetical protein